MALGWGLWEAPARFFCKATKSYKKHKKLLIFTLSNSMIMSNIGAVEITMPAEVALQRGGTNVSPDETRG